MKTIKIRIASEYSSILGGRHISDGQFSGEDFRENHLKKIFESLKSDERLIIDFDGTYGYPTSFLEEAFGGLARIYGSQIILSKIDFISEEEPGLIDEVRRYIENANISK
jgi:hypothetical protein